MTDHEISELYFINLYKVMAHATSQDRIRITFPVWLVRLFSFFSTRAQGLAGTSMCLSAGKLR